MDSGNVGCHDIDIGFEVHGQHLSNAAGPSAPIQVDSSGLGLQGSCPQGGLGMDGNETVSGCAIPLFIQAPISSALAENHRLDSMHPADAGIEEYLDADPSPNPRAAPVDQHGSYLGSAPLALGMYESAQKDGSLDKNSSCVNPLVTGGDLDLTPNSIT
ncbi:hypothetical protein Nepgr_002789 [Nepenthes gracilis]|uniref:Uncharacterized protein n=1 Tax=Nepenthes gracilis TaxID=150966 RepID=A0AAD3RYK7_NEPGR|nr:hypothetical protein Nepgr_002789 [Nepenthes gracilis]